MKTLLRTSLVAFGVVLGSSPAFAQNYRELPIGGRTATMGGAGTAAGNDSAMPYLNPAGLAGVPGDILAVSAAVYAYTHRSYKDLFFPEGIPANYGYVPGKEDFSTSNVTELPSSVMYFRHLNPPDAPIRHKIGVSLVIPGARDVSIVASTGGRTRQIDGSISIQESVTQQQRRYYIGPTYAVAIGEDIHLGLTMYAVYQRRIESASIKGDVSTSGGARGFVVDASNSSVYNSYGLSPIAGIQARLVSNLWAGFGVASPTLHLGGNVRQNSSLTLDTGTGNPQKNDFSGNLSYRDSVPLRLNAGLAWEDRERFSFAADVQMFLGGTLNEVSGVSRAEQRQSGQTSRLFFSKVNASTEGALVVDIGLGGELSLTKMLAARAGFFTDFAPTVNQNEQKQLTFGDMRLNRFGTTFGLGLKVGSFDTTAGVVLVRGTGQFATAAMFASRNLPPIETTESTAMFILSGAVTTEEAKKAIRDALPFAVPLPDLDLGGNKPPAPWIPEPLPQEAKPPMPSLRPAELQKMPEPPKPPVKPGAVAPPRGAQ